MNVILCGIKTAVKDFQFSLLNRTETFLEHCQVSALQYKLAVDVR